MVNKLQNNSITARSVIQLLRSCTLLIILVLYSGCSSSSHIAAVPPGLDLSTTPRQTVALSAERFRFVPDVIHVRAGTLLHLEVTSHEGTHGFEVSRFGIDQTVEEGTTREIELYVGEKGEYPFRCSHFCGLGHFGMKGTIIAE